MKIDFPRILHAIHLGDYAPGMEAVDIQVWVNPPRVNLEKLNDLLKPDANGQPKAELLEWFAEILSQGSTETHWTAGELQQLLECTQDADPRFWFWLQGQVFKAISEHRIGVKKS
jgi:hypothetical protein